MKGAMPNKKAKKEQPAPKKAKAKPAKRRGPTAAAAASAAALQALTEEWTAWLTISDPQNPATDFGLQRSWEPPVAGSLRTPQAEAVRQRMLPLLTNRAGSAAAAQLHALVSRHEESISDDEGEEAITEARADLDQTEFSHFAAGILDDADVSSILDGDGSDVLGDQTAEKVSLLLAGLPAELM